MKKIFIFSMLVFGVLFSGCGGQDASSDVSSVAGISGKVVSENVNNEDNSVSKKSVEGDELNSDLGGDVAVFVTNLGEFKIELFLEESPITAGNFKSLVESGFYDGTKFHRVIKDFMIQGGDPISKDDNRKAFWGTGGSDVIEDEFVEGLSNVRGTISMANAGPNSGSSQFFINVKDNTFLDWDKEPAQSKHPVFGKIVSGMDVVDEISRVSTEARDVPVESVVISKIYIE